MVSSFRHSRNGHSKRSASHTNSCDGASQKTTADNPSKRIKETRPICSLQPVKERERKQGCLTKLKMPVHGRKVLLKPLGDMQFEYLDRRGASYKYTSQLGSLSRENTQAWCRTRMSTMQSLGRVQHLSGLITFYPKRITWDKQQVIVCFQNFG
ncbi:hypothetical protein HU200_066477 [Digitaria exilis]|uniref:Uncharacterized protein n=1 Tax=Digitaria exilis TaxID=1010633 RepID=A0A835A1W6_9POAL|nr:hypothetical protein HU200_066477 [Digitaria exilis]